MKPHLWAFAAVATLVAAGCRSGVNTELLEREIRDQEDVIYGLEDQLECCTAQLQSAMRENAALKRDLTKSGGGGSDAPTTPTIDFPSTPGGGRGAPGSAAPIVEPRIEIEQGQEFDPNTPASGASFQRVTDYRVERIVLNKQLTGGISHDGGGAQGLLVVFEPRNRAGQMLDAPGTISIAVVDPLRQGPAGRLARWDFSPDEAAQSMRKTALGRGFQFELPWPGEPPVNQRLQVFVRYVASDGRKLMADMPIDVSPPTDREARHWRSAPGAARRAQAAAQLRSDRRLAARDAYPQADRIARVADDAPAQPTARFLDPPQIVPETNVADVDDNDDADDDDRDTRPKRKSADRTARPTWTPYR